MNVIDISMELGGALPIWPGSPGFASTGRMEVGRGDEANVSTITMDVHTGTHVDAPRHFLEDGVELETLGIEPFVGSADVVDLTDVDVIDSAALRSRVPDDSTRILLKTSNSITVGFRDGPFRDDYVAISAEGARWLAERGPALVGVDYLSVQRFHDSPETHLVLLSAGIALLEGLVLNDVIPGRYLLACLPLRLQAAEAAPARAILLQEVSA
jgi:arylformamidase